MENQTLQRMHIETRRNGTTSFGCYSAGVLDMEEKAKIAFCKTICKGFQDIGSCMCDGNCEKFNQFVSRMEGKL